MYSYKLLELSSVLPKSASFMMNTVLMYVALPGRLECLSRLGTVGIIVSGCLLSLIKSLDIVVIPSSAK